MSGWRCAQCGEKSSYQGHYAGSGPNGETLFSCSPVPLEGTACWKDDKLKRLRELIGQGRLVEAVQLVDELRLIV